MTCFFYLNSLTPPKFQTLEELFDLTLAGFKNQPGIK